MGTRCQDCRRHDDDCICHDPGGMIDDLEEEVEELRAKLSDLSQDQLELARFLEVPHMHSIYTHCWECHNWGINLPTEIKCGNCGSLETTTYYPMKNKI